jgi:hypothetical protein
MPDAWKEPCLRSFAFRVGRAIKQWQDEEIEQFEAISNIADDLEQLVDEYYLEKDRG